MLPLKTGTFVMPPGRTIGLVNLNRDFTGGEKLGDTVRSRVRVKEAQPKSKPSRSVTSYDFKVLNQRDDQTQHGRMKVIVPLDRETN
jgi:hypothetical protein